MAPIDCDNFVDYLCQALGTDSSDRVLAFPDGHDAQAGFKHYTVKQVHRLTNQAATYFINHGLPVRKKGERPLVVTVIGYGTIEWAVSFYAISRMGHSVCSLSSRLSDAYISGLIEKSGTDVLVHDRPVPHSNVAQRLIAFPTEDDLDQINPKSEDKLICDSSIMDLQDVTNFSHSSGSTNLPKLFPVSHIEWMNRLRIVQKILKQDQSAWFASAMYNAVGMMILGVIPNRLAPAYYENDRTHFTKEGALAFIQEAQPQEIGITPYTLALVASTQAGIDELKKCDEIHMFGAVCPDELGDMLVSQGVNLHSFYAMTEGGTLMTSGIRPEGDTEWQWVGIPPPRLGFYTMKPIDEKQELWEMWCHPDAPNVLPEVKDKDGYFCTGDLFLKHPTKENRWKVVGRRDDQLKIYQNDRQSIVNAIDYEQKLHAGNEHIVDEVVLFGQGRGSLGVLVFAEDAVEGSAKRIKAEQAIWNAVQTEINGKMKTGIDRNMIVIVDTKRVSLPQTGKFNLIRPQVYLHFKDLIDRAYDLQASEPKGQFTVKANGVVNGTFHTNTQPASIAGHA